MNLDIIRDNPIFTRELRRRMRGKALMFTMIFYIAAMCVLAYLTIHWRSRQIALQQLGTYNYLYGGHTQTTIADIGRGIYQLIVFVQSALVLIVAPTITAAMVRSEKERETFEFLRVTTITPSAYVVGAFLSTFLYVMLALFCALPVLMIAYLYGGVSNVVENTLILLALSVVLSAAGLLYSCTCEKSKASHGALVFVIPVLLLWGLLGGWGTALIRMVQLASSQTLILGVGLPPWLLLWLGAGGIAFVLLLISARKLFHIRERALSYWQFALVYVAALAVLAAWMASGTGAGAASGPAVEARARSLAAGYLLLGILMQNTMILSRVDIGNERWKVKKRHPRLRGSDESLLYCIVLLLLGAGIVLGGYAVAWPTQPSRWLGVLPLSVFLLAHAGLCKAVIKRTENEYNALKIVLVSDILFLGLPLLLAAIFHSLSQSSAYWFASFVSPFDVAADIASASRSGIGLVGTAFLTGLAVVAWLSAWGGSEQHELADPHYELSL